MVVTVVAVVVGVAVGLVLKPSVHRFAPPAVAIAPVLVAGVVLLVAGYLAEGDNGVLLELVGYACLVVGAAANVRLAGMGVVLIGLSCNALVIGLDGGMPVHRAALVRIGALRSGSSVSAALRGHRHLEEPRDRLSFLDDRIPLGLGNQVVSFGDLILGVGLADAAAHLARRRRRPVRGTPAPAREAVIDLRDPVPGPLERVPQPAPQPTGLAGAG